jgi:hypothetical protein
MDMFRLIRILVFATVVVLPWTATPASAAVIVVDPAVDATIHDETGNGTFDFVTTTGSTNGVRNFPGFGIDRSVIEYDLSALAGASIGSVTFTYETASYTSPSPLVDILAYVGNGSASLPDATVAASLVGSYDPAQGFGIKTVALDPAVISTLLSGGSFLGLRFEGRLNANTSFYSSEGPPAPFERQRPTLTVETADATAVPEPGSLILLMTGGAGLIARRRAIAATSRV